MPERSEYVSYVEPYFGAGSVLLANDPEGISEVVNDIDGELMNFWRVLQDDTLFQDFKRRIEATPFSEQLWKEVCENRGTYNGVSKCGVDCRVMDACGFFILCRQSLAGRMQDFTSITKTRTRRGMNNEVSAWLSAVEGLEQVHTRLKRVLILCDDALSVIRELDSPKTLFYLDPPYLQETRTSKEVYEHEVDVKHHVNLLKILTTIHGKFMLSGYHSSMYDMWATDNGFTCHEKEVPNNAAHGKTKRRMVECVWTNY